MLPAAKKIAPKIRLVDTAEHLRGGSAMSTLRGYRRMDAMHRKKQDRNVSPLLVGTFLNVSYFGVWQFRFTKNHSSYYIIRAEGWPDPAKIPHQFAVAIHIAFHFTFP